MTLMLVAAVCSKCSEIRAKSRFTFNRGESPKMPMLAEDFVSTPGQPSIREGEPSVCSVCNTPLVIRHVPVETANGVVSRPDAPRVVQESGPEMAGVVTVFAVQNGEDMKEMRPIGPDKLLVITSKRILIVNLNDLVEGP
jgi:hypothetical protein